MRGMSNTERETEMKKGREERGTKLNIHLYSENPHESISARQCLTFSGFTTRWFVVGHTPPLAREAAMTAKLGAVTSKEADCR
jgi:hypothetical protein